MQKHVSFLQPQSKAQYFSFYIIVFQLTAAKVSIGGYQRLQLRVVPTHEGGGGKGNTRDRRPPWWVGRGSYPRSSAHRPGSRARMRRCSPHQFPGGTELLSHTCGSRRSTDSPEWALSPLHGWRENRCKLVGLQMTCAGKDVERRTLELPACTRALCHIWGLLNHAHAKLDWIICTSGLNSRVVSFCLSCRRVFLAFARFVSRE